MAGIFVPGMPNQEAHSAQVGGARGILVRREHPATAAKGVGRLITEDEASHGYLPRGAQFGENRVVKTRTYRVRGRRIECEST